MSQQCTIIIDNEVRCTVKGLHREHINAFWANFGVEAPNHFFHPAFRLGRWDGKLRYFQKNGETYVHLLEDILPALKRFGYSINLVDRRGDAFINVEHVTTDQYKDIIIPDLNEPLILRDYQVEAANSLLDVESGIVVAATSAGKTFIIGSMCDKLECSGLKTIVIVPSRDLVRQTRADLQFLNLNVGEYSGKIKDINHNIVVSTWQALKNQPTLMSHFNVVIVDEVHLAKAQVLNTLLIDHGGHIIKRYGLTGTMPKELADKMTVQCAIGPVQYEVHAKELIDKNYLSQLHINIMQFEENLEFEYEQYKTDCGVTGDKPVTYTKFKDQYLPDYQAEKSFMQKNKTRQQIIADLIIDKRSDQKGNCFVLVNGIKFGRALQELIPDSIFLHAKDDDTARKEAYNLFADNDDVVVIATYNLASTGLNIKRIFNLFFIDPGKSYIRTIQSIGRGLRKAHDKNFVRVYEVIGNLKYAKRHCAERIRYYNEHEYPHTKTTVKL